MCEKRIPSEEMVYISSPTRPLRLYKDCLPFIYYCVDCFKSIASDILITKLELSNIGSLENIHRCPACTEPLNEYNIKYGVGARMIYECHSCHKFQTETSFNGIISSPVGAF